MYALGMTNVCHLTTCYLDGNINLLIASIQMLSAGNVMKKVFCVLVVFFAIGFLAVSCGGKKKTSGEPKTLSQLLKSGIEKISETADEYARYSDSDRVALAATLDLMGYGRLRSQIMGEITPKIAKSQYRLYKNSTSYGLFGIKVLTLKAGESLKASFNYTIIGIESDQCALKVELSDFASDSEPISAYYFGDLTAFGPNGPSVGQEFLAYVSYHASTIKVGIALPIIVIDGIKPQ
jgi:hypothetical protein